MLAGMSPDQMYALSKLRMAETQARAQNARMTAGRRPQRTLVSSVIALAARAGSSLMGTWPHPGRGRGSARRSAATNRGAV